MKIFVIGAVLVLLMNPSFAGIKLSLDVDNSMLGVVPDFPDRYDAIFYGLINNQNKNLKVHLMDKLASLEREIARISFTEDNYEERRSQIMKLLERVTYTKNAWIVATDNDYAMLSQEDKVAKYEKMHGMKFKHVGATFYAGSEPVRR